MGVSGCGKSTIARQLAEELDWNFFDADNFHRPHALQERMKSEAPLAARMRPRTLDEYTGQEHIVDEGKLLRRAIEADKLFSSIILWGPPGTGKTTSAQVIANTTRSHFVTISAIFAGKAELREVVEAALERRRLHNERTILFVKQVLETPNSTRSIPFLHYFFP